MKNKSKSDDILMLLKTFSGSYAAELSSKMDRLNILLGEGHWPSVGSYKESILKNHLTGKIPKRYEVSTGFTLSSAYKKK